MSIVGDYDELDRLAAKFRGAVAIVRASVRDAAEAVQDVAHGQFAAGQDPDGKRWKPKKDGGRPLARAPERVWFRAVGLTIYERAPAHYDYHQRGTTSKSGKERLPPRRVYPTKGQVPPRWLEAMDAALLKSLERRLRP